MADIKKKKIKILSPGILPVDTFIYGPVLTPYYESIDTIFKLISAKIKVLEVLEDGKEVTLTMSNLNKDNNVKVEPKAVKKEEKKEVEKEEEVKEQPKSYKKNNYKEKKEDKKVEPEVEELQEK